jgi:hypothetical protein
MRKIILLILATLLLQKATLAQNTWTGSTNTRWDEATNWSTGLVPTDSDDVVIAAATNQPVISTAGEVAKTVEVQSGAVLTIGSVGSLAVNGSKIIPIGLGVPSAFYNTGTVNNNGQLLIGYLSDAGNDALLNNGTVENSGQLGIGSGFYSLVNDSTFNNNTGGQITIDNAKGASLFNFSGTFNNAGAITIGSVASGGLRALFNSATFNNNTGGQITIDRSIDVGLQNFGGTFTNAALITIGATASVGIFGLDNDSTFNNNTGGQITIDNVSTYGLANTAGTFTNAATIIIGAVAGVGQYGLYSPGTFNNSNCSAVLRVVSNSVIAGVDFTNAGTVIENASGNSGISTNSGLVQNLAGGTFTIINNTGVLTTTAGTIWKGCTNTEWTTASNWSTGQVPTASDDVIIAAATNQPVISTAGALAKTVEVQSGALLTINSTGSLAVNGSKDISGKTNAFYNAGTVYNNGQLLIGNLSAVGDYGLYNITAFNNNTGGQISIDNSTIAGLDNEGGTFTNAATLTIGAVASVGTYGLQNSGTFNNSACAVLSLFAPLNNQEILTNAGLFTVNTTGTHTNTTGFTNNGILVYPQGNPIPNVTNQAVVVTPLSTCATVVTPALEISNNNPFTIGSTWYKEKALTQPAGTFTVGNNTFMATTPITGNTTVYFTASSITCTQTVAIPLTLKPLPQLTSTLTPADICNKAAFSYTPIADLTGTSFSWSRNAVSGISNVAATGTGSINEALDNTTSAPVQVTYAYNLTNSNGCSSASPYNVVVTVKPSPSVRTKNITVYLGANGQVSITPQQVDDGSQGYCGTLSLSLDKATFNCTNTGNPVQVSLTATDDNGNQSSASALVTVVDNLKPVINFPANITNVNPTSLNGAVVNYNTPVGTDNCTGAITQRTAGLASGATFPIGTTTVSYKVTDASTNSVSCSFTVTVRSPYADNNKQKVYVCHHGNTLSINKNDVQDHLNHGDKLGRCEWYTASQLAITSTVVGEEAEKQAPPGDSPALKLKLYPNPTTGQFMIELHLSNNINTNAKIELVNMMGQTVSSENTNISNGILQKTVTISSSLTSGIYIARIIVNNETYQARVVYGK